MRKVSIKKIEIAELKVLEFKLNNFIIDKAAEMLKFKHSDQYLAKMLQLDTAQAIYIRVWNVIRRAARNVASMSVTATEAIVLIQLCIDTPAGSEFENYVVEKIKTILHKELINLI